MLYTLESFWERCRIYLPGVTVKEVSGGYYRGWGVADTVNWIEKIRKLEEQERDRPQGQSEDAPSSGNAARPQ